MAKRPMRLLVVISTLMLMVTSGTAAADPPERNTSPHEQAVAFWTHERVSKAVPRDFIRTPGGGFAPAAKPDNPGKPGGGGGGGDDGTVKGASWNGGGLVAETTGKVLFSIGGSYYVCSASAVVDPDGTSDSDSLILTAGHCAYDETGGQFADNWIFIPNYDAAPAPLSTSSTSFCADTVYGCWSARAITVHQGYASAGGFNDQAVVHDFAVVTVGPGGHTASDLEVTVGAQGIAFTDIVGDNAHAFGYPAAKKYKGNDLAYCAGPVGTDPNTGGATYRIACDMTGGSSGGPWLSPFTTSSGIGTLASVNSYGYQGDSSMYGPKLNDDAQLVFSAANNATTDRVVGTFP